MSKFFHIPYWSTVAPSAPGSGYFGKYILFADSIERIMDSQGTSTPTNNCQVSSAIAQAAVANVDTKIDAGILVSLNTLTAGSKIRITIMGTCTAGAGGAQIFKIRFGSANTVADTQIGTISLTSATSGTAIPFKLEIEFTVRTIGASGTIYGYATLINGDAAITGIYTKATSIFLIGNLASLVSNATGYFGLSYISGSASVTTTFQNVIMELIRQ